MTSFDSLYMRYKMPSDAYTSFAPTTERAVGRRGRVGFPADYPLAFQDAGALVREGGHNTVIM